MIDFKIDNCEIEKSFDDISEILFNESLLISGDKKYRLTEIEFYYFNKQNHPDPYTHRHDLQLKNNTWYFHPSGLDITVGNGENYCGILIRGIIDIKTKIDICGPLNVVQEIFKNIKSIQVQNNLFGLEKTQLGKMEIIKTIRVLDKQKVKSQEYLDKSYRHLIFPEKKHKNKFDYQKS